MKKGPMHDLLKQPIPLPDPLLLYKRGHFSPSQPKKDEPRGYAAAPGTGPAGETCRTCAHSCLNAGNSKNYWKCGLLKFAWTRSPRTDIRLKSHACLHWEQHTDFHAGDKVMILSDSRKNRRPHTGIVRGPSAATGFFEVTLHYRRRQKHIHLPVSKLRYIRSAK